MKKVISLLMPYQIQLEGGGKIQGDIQNSKISNLVPQRDLKEFQRRNGNRKIVKRRIFLKNSIMVNVKSAITHLPKVMENLILKEYIWSQGLKQPGLIGQVMSFVCVPIAVQNSCVGLSKGVIF